MYGGPKEVGVSYERVTPAGGVTLLCARYTCTCVGGPCVSKGHRFLAKRRKQGYLAHDKMSPPWDRHRSLGIVVLYGATGWRFLKRGNHVRTSPREGGGGGVATEGLDLMMAKSVLSGMRWSSR